MIAMASSRFVWIRASRDVGEVAVSVVDVFRLPMPQGLAKYAGSLPILGPRARVGGLRVLSRFNIRYTVLQAAATKMLVAASVMRSASSSGLS